MSGVVGSQEWAASASHLDLLQQKRWWRTSDGRVMRRREMELAHKLSLLGWLERSAKSIAVSMGRASAVQSAHVALMHGYGDAPDGVFSAMCQWEGEAQRAMEDPTAFVRRQVMYRYLLRDIARELMFRVTSADVTGVATKSDFYTGKLVTSADLVGEFFEVDVT